MAKEIPDMGDEAPRANEPPPIRQVDRHIDDAPGERSDGFAERMAIRADLESYVREGRVRFNPDTDLVDRIIAGLAARERKTGMRLCPCRLAKNDPVEDRKIVCPCIYHLDEIAADGHCHCDLFVRP